MSPLPYDDGQRNYRPSARSNAVKNNQFSIEANSRDGGSKLDQRSAPEESRRYAKGSKPPHSEFRTRRHTGNGAHSYNTPAPTGKNS